MHSFRDALALISQSTSTFRTLARHFASTSWLPPEAPAARLRAENANLRAELAAAKATIARQVKLIEAQATVIENLKPAAE